MVGTPGQVRCRAVPRVPRARRTQATATPQQQVPATTQIRADHKLLRARAQQRLSVRPAAWCRRHCREQWSPETTRHKAGRLAIPTETEPPKRARLPITQTPTAAAGVEEAVVRQGLTVASRPAQRAHPLGRRLPTSRVALEAVEAGVGLIKARQRVRSSLARPHPPHHRLQHRARQLAGQQAAARVDRLRPL